MRKIAYFLLLVSLIFSAEIFPLSKVKPGLQGYGYSVFQGTEPQRFDVEILGVINNLSSDFPLIIARLKGKFVEGGGVISGMSGSPVYIDGKILGAVAYGFQFSKEPIAGIVPIKAILKEGAPTQERKVYTGPIRKKIDFEALLQGISPPLPVGSMRPLPLPLSASFTSPYLEALARRGNFTLTPSSSLSSSLSLRQETLNGGDAVSVLLTAGDIEISAGGTVVYREGDKVYIFGHPFYNLGKVNYFLSRAKVIGVVKSYSSPFKIMQPLYLVGRATEDRAKAVVGELGKLPNYIPVKIRFKSPVAQREYNFWLTSDPLLSPALMLAIEQWIITLGAKNYGNITLRVKGNIALKEGHNVFVNDMFVGNNLNDILGLDAAILYYLVNNPYKRADIDSINLDYRIYEEDKTATITKIWAPKYDVSAGERIPVTVFLKPKNGAPVSKTFPVKIPEVAPGEDLYLLVASAQDLIKWEMKYYRGAAQYPPSFQRLLRVLNNLRKNNNLYFKFFVRKPSVFLKGEELPSLPPTLMELYTSPYTSYKGMKTPISTIIEYRAEVPWFLRGAKIIKFSTRREE